MGTIYFKASNDCCLLANKVIKDFHPLLIKSQVKVGILMVVAGKEGQAAIKEAGNPVFGSVKIVPVKDRITKNYDAEILIDGDFWKEHPDKQIPLLDHLLSKIDVKVRQAKKKPRTDDDDENEQPETAQEEVVVDDIGRPVLKIRKSDWSITGFAEVAVRHGNLSIEMSRITQALEHYEHASKEKTNEEVS
jgi:hypothetical protein